jgi:hypothetical protein
LMVNRSLHASAVLRLSPQSERARLVSLQEGQMDAYRVLLLALCLTVLGVSQEVGAGTLAVEADQVVNISGSLVLAYSVTSPSTLVAGFISWVSFFTVETATRG